MILYKHVKSHFWVLGVSMTPGGIHTNRQQVILASTQSVCVLCFCKSYSMVWAKQLEPIKAIDGILMPNTLSFDGTCKLR